MLPPISPLNPYADTPTAVPPVRAVEEKFAYAFLLRAKRLAFLINLYGF